MKPPRLTPSGNHAQSGPTGTPTLTHGDTPRRTPALKRLADGRATASQTARRGWLRILAAILVSLALWALILWGASAALAHVAGCHTRACDRRISHKRHTHFWVRRFHAFPISWQNWAHSTSWCEAHHQAHTNTGNGFYGGFQYTLQTAWVAGFHRRPDLTTWFEQAVRSIRYAERNGTGAWPVCGR